MPNIMVSPRELHAIERRRDSLEKKIVRTLIRALKTDGYLPDSVWDGEESVKARTETAVMGVVFSVSSSTIHFDRGKGDDDKSNHGVAIVLGNGVDCISDWHINDKSFDAVVGRVSDWTSTLEE